MISKGQKSSENQMGGFKHNYKEKTKVPSWKNKSGSLGSLKDIQQLMGLIFGVILLV